MPLSSFASYVVPAAAVLNVCGSGVYALRTLRGSVRPNPVTWLLWTLAPGVAFAAQVAHHAGLSAITTLSVGLGPLLVCLCALSRPELRSTRPPPAELCCAGLCVGALVGWWLTADPDTALALSILADGCAALPTVVKCYRYPETEERTAYTLMAVSAAVTLLTLSAWTFAAAGFSCYLVALYATLLVLLRGRSARPGLDALQP
ncbi:hypothetical protein [Streptomyces sp. CBMA123]|uniref:hypothetical protein n=1 Tax=Streptomyces sp. CBMA123 TaxID=1896313 RepID=UPI001661E46F|nr:hypothetical protein [Streptomyces sp. CBMA123]MBD0690872.1 hypothetical protein [Streptomyces sp. CBMA123]